MLLFGLISLLWLLFKLFFYYLFFVIWTFYFWVRWIGFIRSGCSQFIWGCSQFFLRCTTSIYIKKLSFDFKKSGCATAHPCTPSLERGAATVCCNCLIMRIWENICEKCTCQNHEKLFTTLNDSTISSNLCLVIFRLNNTMHIRIHLSKPQPSSSSPVLKILNYFKIKLNKNKNHAFLFTFFLHPIIHSNPSPHISHGHTTTPLKCVSKPLKKKILVMIHEIRT